MQALCTILLALGAVVFASQILKWRLDLVHIKQHSDTNPRQCWRFVLSVMVACMISLLIIYISFPNARWRDQLLVIVGTGAFPGLIFGSIWQIVSKDKISPYLRRGLCIVGFGAFLILASVLLGNAVFDLRQQQLNYNKAKVIRLLGNNDILKVNFILENGKGKSLISSKETDGFKKYLVNARVSNLENMEESIFEKVQIKITTNENEFEYNGYIVRSSTEDIFLTFSKDNVETAICLPGLKRWLDENVFQE